tara:strand:+ start:5617 stop:5826 length:210 start_codon:yes stop_codon:yes gene_type:complete
MPLDMIRALDQYIVLTNSNKSHTMLTAIAKKIGYIGNTGTVDRPAANPTGNPHNLVSYRPEKDEANDVG